MVIFVSFLKNEAMSDLLSSTDLFADHDCVVSEKYYYADSGLIFPITPESFQGTDPETRSFRLCTSMVMGQPFIDVVINHFTYDSVVCKPIKFEVQENECI